MYKRSPAVVQDAAIGARALLRGWLREGSAFRRVLSEIDQTQWLSGEALREWQERRLAAVLREAADHVPYYGDRLPRGQGDAALLRAWQQLPVLTRQDVIGAGQDLVTERWGLRFKGSTSGTTGSPLTVVQDMTAIIRENAFIWRQLSWAGFRRGERRAWIRGDLVVPFDNQDGIYWRLNKPENMLMFSSYHLRRDTAQAYVSKLAEFDPVLIQAYPSSIGYLAQWLDGEGRDYPAEGLKGIVTSSESLSAEQREVIERRFGARVFDWYGSLERVAAIGTCEHGTYHVMEDYGLLETVADNEGSFRIVGTAFNNTVMPLLRYDVGDCLVLPEDGRSCPCGRSFRIVEKIAGRQDDYVITADGRWIGRLDHIYKGVRGIAEGQIVQEANGAVRLRIVPTAVFDAQQEQRLLRNARDRLGSALDVSLERVEHIERTASGKIRAVVRVPREARA